MEIPKQIISECRKRLLQMKQDLLNSMRLNQQALTMNNKAVGDEADQTAALLEENALLTNNGRFRAQLLEIEMALSRIERGVYGVCEETQEPIEIERLMALPYTRFSIEGAEIRESLGRRWTSPSRHT